MYYGSSRACAAMQGVFDKWDREYLEEAIESIKDATDPDLILLREKGLKALEEGAFSIDVVKKLFWKICPIRKGV